MPRKTSVYLTDEADAIVHAEMARGVTLAEIIRRGAGAAGPDEALAQMVLESALDALRKFAQEAAREAAEAVAEELREIVRSEVRRAMGEMQGGGY